MIKSNTRAMGRNKIRIFSILRMIRLQPGVQGGVGSLGLASRKQHDLGSRSSALEARIDNDSDRKFSNSKIFHSFLETTFSTFHVTL